MHAKQPAALLALATALVLVASSQAAAAVRWFTVSPAGTISAPSSGTLRFTTGGIEVRCNVTLSGSLSEGIIQTEADPFGAITAVSSSACSGGELETSLALPWTLGYRSLLGTAPFLTGLQFNMLQATIPMRVFGVRCVYRGDIGALLALSGSNPYRSGSISLLGNEVALREGFLCPSSGRVTGSLSLSPTQTLRAFEQPGIAANVQPPEAVEAGHRLVFPNTRLGFFGPLNLTITATQGAWRFGPCQTSDFEHFTYDVGGPTFPCNRMIDANDPNNNQRILRLRFIPDNTATVDYSAMLTQIQPLPDMTMRGRKIP